MLRGPCWDICFDLLIWEWVEGNSIGRGQWTGALNFIKGVEREGRRERGA